MNSCDDITKNHFDLIKLYDTDKDNIINTIEYQKAESDYMKNVISMNDFMVILNFHNNKCNLQSSTQTPYPSTGSIKCTCNVAGQVALDGSNIRITPYTFANVNVGNHTLLFSKTGYNSRPYNVFVSANSTATIYGVLSLSSTYTPTPHITPTPGPTNSYNNWLNNKGGQSGLKYNLSALLEIIDGYLGFKNLGFSVSLFDLLSTLDSYLGIQN